MPVLESQIGRFKIPQALFHEERHTEIELVMAKCVVKSRMYNVAEQCVEYAAYSECFDSIVADEPVPWYEWVFSSAQGAPLTVTAQRIPA